jgi:hypothetical protein
MPTYPPKLHPTVETALLGAASFLNSDRTKTWLADKMDTVSSNGSNFNLDYIIRIHVPSDGEPSVRLLTQPNNAAVQLASWGAANNNG